MEEENKSEFIYKATVSSYYPLSMSAGNMRGITILNYDIPVMAG